MKSNAIEYLEKRNHLTWFDVLLGAILGPRQKERITIKVRNGFVIQVVDRREQYYTRYNRNREFYNRIREYLKGLKK